MQEYKNLQPIIRDKIIAKNFGSIGHITGSKMIDRLDSLLSIEEEDKT